MANSTTAEKLIELIRHGALAHASPMDIDEELRNRSRFNRLVTGYLRGAKRKTGHSTQLGKIFPSVETLPQQQLLTLSKVSNIQRP